MKTNKCLTPMTSRGIRTSNLEAKIMNTVECLKLYKKSLHMKVNEMFTNSPLKYFKSLLVIVKKGQLRVGKKI